MRRLVLLLWFVPVAAGAQLTVPLWPASSAAKGAGEHTRIEPPKPANGNRSITIVTDVSQPTLTVFLPPKTSQATAAALVFPGGGYKALAYDLEGTEVCDWLNSLGMACLVVKYRVPYSQHFPEREEDLKDAQQAMRITLHRSAEWNIDVQRIGVLGFSAGAHLAAVLSTHPGPAAEPSPVDGPALRPAFAALLYPGYLVQPNTLTLAEGLQPLVGAPPTFLLQSEDDPVGVENVVGYFEALKRAKVPAEMHIYAQGGHGYGLRAIGKPIAQWPALAERWLRTIGMLPASP